MSTLRERFEDLYDWAIVPVDAECHLEPCEFDMLMRWQWMSWWTTNRCSIGKLIQYDVHPSEMAVVNCMALLPLPILGSLGSMAVWTQEL